MRVLKGSPWLTSLGVVMAVLVLTGARAEADTTSDRSGSIVIFPKVIADSSRDTLISLTNTSNMQRFAHCEYTLGVGVCSLPPGGLCTSNLDCSDEPGDFCDIVWATRNFDLILTVQQPTIWRVSTGRVFDPSLPANGQCIEDGRKCPGFFFTTVPNGGDPSGNLPPPPGGGIFQGELRCVQVEVDGSASAANSLKGEAIIESLGTNQISIYNSVNIQAPSGGGSADSIFELNDAEYYACPRQLTVNHYVPGATDLIANAFDPGNCTGGCPVRTELTITPCRVNYVTEEPPFIAVQRNFFDEFESTGSAFFDLFCWANLPVLPDGLVVNPATFARTVVRTKGWDDEVGVVAGGGICIAGNLPMQAQARKNCLLDTDCGAGGVCGPPTGILAIVEEFHMTDSSLAFFGAHAATNAHMVDLDLTGSGDVGRLGRCRGAISTVCANDTDCGGSGFCRIGAAVVCSSDAGCGGDLNQCDICMFDEITFDPALIIPDPS